MAAKSHPENLERARAAQAERGRRGRRLTTAGRERTRNNLVTWATENPEEAQAAAMRSLERARSAEALAKRSATIQAQLAANPELKMKRYAHLNTPENRAKAIAAATAVNRRPLPPHGNINRYKHHKCRCDLCRVAKADDRQRLKKQREND
jgi:hypothetical protein